MITIRNYTKDDFEAVKELDFMMGLSMNWNGIYHDEDSFVAEEDGAIVGAGALAYDGTWYYLDQDRDDISRYRLLQSVTAKENREDFEEILSMLVDRLKERMEIYRAKYPDKNLEISCFVENQELDEMAFYLKKGYVSHNLIWVLGFDLTGDIPSYDIPKEITIGRHDFEGDGMKNYMIANEAGFGGVSDAEAELWFNLSGESTAVFTAKEGEKVIAATTIWAISDGRSATENIFTIPEYRHQNIVRATLARALTELKNRGEKLATLTCIGDNRPAINMYLSMGFQLKYYIVEMCESRGK